MVDLSIYLPNFSIPPIWLSGYLAISRAWLVHLLLLSFIIIIISVIGVGVGVVMGWEWGNGGGGRGCFFVCFYFRVGGGGGTDIAKDEQNDDVSIATYTYIHTGAFELQHPCIHPCIRYIGTWTNRQVNSIPAAPTTCTAGIPNNNNNNNLSSSTKRYIHTTQSQAQSRPCQSWVCIASHYMHD